jgi:hypothetical protein
LEFPLACGITVGTPVRIRGVAVGSVMNVKPSLDRVDVLVEVRTIVEGSRKEVLKFDAPSDDCCNGGLLQHSPALLSKALSPLQCM